MEQQVAELQQGLSRLLDENRIRSYPHNEVEANRVSRRLIKNFQDGME